MTPWSVRPMAGWSNAAARSASLSMLQAPSSSEYSEWTWRCATVGELIGEGTIGVASDRIGASPRNVRDKNGAMSLYTSLGVPRVINACGIYTDLGGSVLSPRVLAAVAEAATTWASMDTMLATSGRRIAGLVGAEAARVVPGASAG